MGAHGAHGAHETTWAPSGAQGLGPAAGAQGSGQAAGGPRAPGWVVRCPWTRAKMDRPKGPGQWTSMDCPKMGQISYSVPAGALPVWVIHRPQKG